MSRYVDADALKTDILKKYKQNWEVPCSYEDRIIQRVVTDLRVLIEQNTPADVVPKSESEFDSIPVDVAQVLKEKAVKKAKSDVAREIFEEIESIINEPFAVGFNLLAPLKQALGEYNNGIRKDLLYYIAELKKEYTEEKK